MAYLQLRGKIWWFKMRTPRRYLSVHPEEFIRVSLKTDSRVQAEALVGAVRQSFLNDLEVRLSQGAGQVSREAYEAVIAVANTHNLRLKSKEQVLSMNPSELGDMINYVMEKDPQAKTSLLPVALGTFGLPPTTLMEMAKRMEEVHSDIVGPKNGRQRGQWTTKYTGSAKEAIHVLGSDKAIKDITQDDADTIRRYLKDRTTKKMDGKEVVTTATVNKKLGYLRGIVETYYADLKISKFTNPLKVERIRKTSREARSKEDRKPEFPPSWIKKHIIDGESLNRLNPDAAAILTICAETGCRESEIFDIDPASIRLNDETPHIKLNRIEEGEFRKELKNKASIRDVPLVGAALEEMRKYPEGFPRYRGNANYYACVSKYFKSKDIMPTPEHTIGGLRHSIESRLRRAGVSNEDRGFIMGHSMKQLRRREFYGDETGLKLKALYIEMVALPTANWQPRSHEELNAEIDKILKEEGFRIA